MDGISKIIPSFFTIKEGSTFLTKPLFPQGREDVIALQCSEPLRYKVGGPSKVCAISCGLGPPGVGGSISGVIIAFVKNKLLELVFGREVCFRYVT